LGYSNLMGSTPHSFYVTERPIRLAFVLNTDTVTDEQLDAILAYNRSKWGGRYNPLIPTDGETLSTEAWALLHFVDPDFVRTVTPLSTDLVTAIDRRLSPLVVESIDNEDDPVRPIRHPDREGIAILPTRRAVAEVAQVFGTPTVVIPELTEDSPASIRTFVQRTLGTFDDLGRTRRALEENESQARLRISDLASLATAFEQLSAFRTFVYPVQISALPDDLPDSEWTPDCDSLTVVVGDSVADLLYFWNRIHLVPQWKRRELTQAWLPHWLASESTLTSALGAWLRRLGDRSGTGQPWVHFVSRSLPQEELEALIAPLRPHVRLLTRVTALKESEALKSRGRSPLPRVRPWTQPYSGMGRLHKITRQGHHRPPHPVAPDGQVRALLDNRMGEALEVGLTAGAVRSV
jgi:hypothetical protein